MATVIHLRTVVDNQPSPAMARGGLLAVRMLEELSEESAREKCIVSDEWRTKGAPQRNVVAMYLAELCAATEEERRGFGRVLTEAIATSELPALDWLECIAQYGFADAEREFASRISQAQSS